MITVNDKEGKIHITIKDYGKFFGTILFYVLCVFIGIGLILIFSMEINYKYMEYKFVALLIASLILEFLLIWQLLRSCNLKEYTSILILDKSKKNITLGEDKKLSSEEYKLIIERSDNRNNPPIFYLYIEGKGEWHQIYDSYSYNDIYKLGFLISNELGMEFDNKFINTGIYYDYFTYFLYIFLVSTLIYGIYTNFDSFSFIMNN